MSEFDGVFISYSACLFSVKTFTALHAIEMSRMMSLIQSTHQIWQSILFAMKLIFFRAFAT